MEGRDTGRKLTLIGLNNTVVGLRAVIQKARVHLIHKLTRNAEQIKKKKGSEKQVEQNNRKAQRFVQEVLIMKNLDKKEVAKFALGNQVSWLPEISTNDEQDVEQLLTKRAMIRISNFHEVKKKVEEFRKEFPCWEQEMQGLVGILGKKQQLKDARTKRQKRRLEKANRKRLNAGKEDDEDEPDIENMNISDDEDSEKKLEVELKPASGNAPNGEDEETEDQTDDEDDMDEESDDDEITLDSLNKENDAKNLDEEVEDTESDVSEDGILEHEENLVNIRSQRPKIVNKRQGQMEIKTIDMDGEEEDDELGESADENDQEPLPETTSRKKDSFFLGGESSSEDDDEDGQGEAKERERPDFFYKSGPSHQNHRGRGQSGRGRMLHNDSRSYRHDSGFGRWRGDGRGRGTRGTRGGFGARDDYSRDYSIRSRGEFRGSRGQSDFIRGRGDVRRGGESFRGQGSLGDFSRNRDDSFRGRGSFESRGSFKGKSRPEDPNIHPSWAAKRKQTGISEFQGKKIKFGDDSASSPASFAPPKPKEAPKAEGLHPSWAAKKEKTGIQEFKGKKIVFGD